MIKLEQATIAYDKQKPIFKDLTLELESGKIIGLIAPSGAGKTTLINAIIGMKKIKSGLILIDNNNVRRGKHFNRIGLMPQDYGLYDELSGYDNYQFFSKLKQQKVSKQEAKEIFKELGLEKDLDKKVSDYSGGMKRKLSLLIASINDPDYLFLDEPTVGIDPLYKEQIWDKFRSYCQQGKFVLVTTHVMDEARQCDQIIVLNHGQILINDTYQNIITKLGVDNLEDAVIKLIKEGR